MTITDPSGHNKVSMKINTLKDNVIENTLL